MLNKEKKEIVEVLLSDRLFLYSLMHKVFGREPDAGFLDILTSEAASEAFCLLSEKEDDVMARCPRFLAQLREEAADPSFIDQVKNEYTRLFIGPARLVAPPWESVYRSKQGLLFQESTLAVRRSYQRFHMLPKAYPNVADDSAALELDFMSRLSQKALDALRAGDLDRMEQYLKGQESFLQSHLLIWIPKFLERMADSPSDILYPQMCLILNEFLIKDQKLIGEVLAMLETQES